MHTALRPLSWRFQPLDLFEEISQYTVLPEPNSAHIKKMLIVAAASIKSLTLTLGDPAPLRMPPKSTVLPDEPISISRDLIERPNILTISVVVASRVAIAELVASSCLVS